MCVINCKSFIPVCYRQDVMGSHQTDVGGELVKTRLDEHGNPKDEPFSAFGLTLEGAKQFIGEGCRVHGSVYVKKVHYIPLFLLCSFSKISTFSGPRLV